MGLGHVAVRDFIGFLKYTGTDANPLRGTQMAYDRSQTGRCATSCIAATAKTPPAAACSTA